MSVLRRIGAIEREIGGARDYEAYLARLTDQELAAIVRAHLRELCAEIPHDRWHLLPAETRELIDAVIIPRDEK